MNRINVNDVIGTSRVSMLQILILLLCSLCTALDGYDVQAIGYAAPSIIQTLQIPKTAFGLIFSAGFVGMTVGAIGLGILADVVGKRKVLIGATIFLALSTGATAYANSTSEFIALRFLTGLSMGTLVPNALALVNEYSPSRLRVRMVMIAGAGFVVGGALGGFLAAHMIPLAGWRSVFLAAVPLALVLAFAMWLGLPDSLQYLVLRHASQPKLRGLVRRIDSALPLDAETTFVVDEAVRQTEPVGILFRNNLALGTLLLWAVNFMGLLCLYFFASWLPILVGEAGYASSAVYAGTAFWVGGVVGCGVLVWIINRRGFGVAIATSFCVAAVCVITLGQASSMLWLIFASATVAGMCFLSAPPSYNTLAATFYPSAIRATGMGWAGGIGRLGSIFGPLIGGELMRRGYTPHDLFNASLIPILGVILCGIAFRILQIPNNPKRLPESYPDAQQTQP